MNDDESRYFCCPVCELRIGEIEPDGALLMYPGVRVARCDMVCLCGHAIAWHSHEAAMGRLVARVLRMRGTVGSPCGMLT